MGANQSLPKITPQDRAILESVFTILLPGDRDWRPLSLKLQRDKLKQYQKKVSQLSLVPWERQSNILNLQIQAVLDREHWIAKAQIAEGKQDRALIALRRRKYQQGLLTKTDAQLENLEQLVRALLHLWTIWEWRPQVSTIEFSLVEVSVLHGLEQGNEVLKEIHKEMNVESVERLLEETAEAREYQKVRNFLLIWAVIDLYFL